MGFEKNANAYRREVAARLKKLADFGPMIDGSLVVVRRRCGNPRCRCARGEKHPAHNLTRQGQSEKDYKQDCELKGAYRLLPRLKEDFPCLEACLLLQIAHTLTQLFEARMGGKKAVTARWGSLAELADALKRSLLADDLPAGQELHTCLETPIQVRLDTS
jgi:hypothetical protein